MAFASLVKRANLRIAMIGLAIFSIQSLLVLMKQAEFGATIQQATSRQHPHADGFFGEDSDHKVHRHKKKRVVNTLLQKEREIRHGSVKLIIPVEAQKATQVIKPDVPLMQNEKKSEILMRTSPGNEKKVDSNNPPDVPGDEIKSAPKRERGGYTDERARRAKPSKPTKPLNIVLLYPDDWRHDTIGGVAPVVRTPFLNELARDGIRFTHNCVTTSVCWISRATMFTGQYVSRHKSYLLKTPEFHKNFHNESWPGILRNQGGYHTGHFGKWQYVAQTPFEVERNFVKAKISGARHWSMHKGVRTHDSDVARDNALEFLDERPKDKPFAMTVAFYPPKAVGGSTKPGGQWHPKPDTMHLFVNETVPPPKVDMDESWNRIPKQLRRVGPARNRFMERFNTTEKYQGAMKNYYRLVYTVDEACRTLVDKLKEQGVYNETLIIFTTDNGLFHGEHGLAGKWYPYQESIRVPLIIRDPRMPQAKRGTLDDSFTLNIDLASTILGAAGIEQLPQMQGRDISDLYLPEPKSDERWRDEWYYEWTVDDSPRFPMSTALVRKDFKYMYWPQFLLEQMFHLEADPMEEHDIIRQKNYTNKLVEMRRRHNELREAVK